MWDERRIPLLFDRLITRNMSCTFRRSKTLAQAGTFRRLAPPGLPWLHRSYVPPPLWIREKYWIFKSCVW